MAFWMGGLLAVGVARILLTYSDSMRNNLLVRRSSLASLGFYRSDEGFTGAERALLLGFGLAIVLVGGTVVRGASGKAAGDARRVLSEQGGAERSIMAVAEPMRAAALAPAQAVAAAPAALFKQDGTIEAPPVPQAPAAEEPPPPVTKVLDITWKGQEQYYYCGPASTRMALSARMSDPPDQDTLARAMGTGTGGTNHIGLVKDTLNQVLGTTWYEVKTMNDPPTQEQRDLLRRDVVSDISKGYPIVANVVSGWRPPGYPGGEIYHYVSVVGYDASGDRVLIADPAGECSGGATWCNVPRTYWVSIDDLGTWIGGKGYAA